MVQEKDLSLSRWSCLAARSNLTLLTRNQSLAIFHRSTTRRFGTVECSYASERWTGMIPQARKAVPTSTSLASFQRSWRTEPRRGKTLGSRIHAKSRPKLPLARTCSCSRARAQTTSFQASTRIPSCTNPSKASSASKGRVKLRRTGSNSCGKIPLLSRSSQARIARSNERLLTTIIGLWPRQKAIVKEVETPL